MSWDLSFFTAPGAHAPSIDAVDTHFTRRRHYRVADGSAAYANEQTGVVFSVDYGEARRADGRDPIRMSAPVDANQTRGFEIVEEVGALVDAFGLLVRDGTMEGMGEGALDRARLLRGLTFAARFGAVVEIHMKRLTAKSALLYDDDRLEAEWRWNRAIEELARPTGDRTFVPRVSYVAHKGRVLSTVAWTGDIAALLPDVDAVTIPRKSKAGVKLATIAMASIAAALETFPLGEAPMRHRILDFESTPESLARALAVAKALSPASTPVATQRVLGARFFDAAIAHHAEWSGGTFYDDRVKLDALVEKARTSPKRWLPKLDAMVDGAASDAAKVRVLTAKADLLEELERFDEADEARGAILALRPGDDDAWFQRAARRSNRGRPDLALPDIERAIALKPRDAANIALHVNVLYSLGRFEDAIAAADRAGVSSANERDDDAEHRDTIALLRELSLFEAARYDEALTALSARLAAAPGEARLYNSMADALAALDRNDEARRAYATALTLADEALASDDADAMAWNRRGYALLGLDRVDEAHEALERAASIDPENDVVARNRVRAALLRNAASKAAALSDEARALDRFWPHGMLWSALAHGRAGLVAQAHAALAELDATQGRHAQRHPLLAEVRAST